MMSDWDFSHYFEDLDEEYMPLFNSTVEIRESKFIQRFAAGDLPGLGIKEIERDKRRQDKELPTVWRSDEEPPPYKIREHPLDMDEVEDWVSSRRPFVFDPISGIIHVGEFGDHHGSLPEGYTNPQGFLNFKEHPEGVSTGYGNTMGESSYKNWAGQGGPRPGVGWWSHPNTPQEQKKIEDFLLNHYGIPDTSMGGELHDPYWDRKNQWQFE